MSSLTGADVLESVWALTNFSALNSMMKWEETNENVSEVSSGLLAHSNNFDCCFTHFKSKSKSYTVQISHMGYMCTGNGQRLVSHSNGFY